MQNIPNHNTAFFHIINCFINNSHIDWRVFQYFSREDWRKFHATAKQQGVTAIVFNQIKSIPKEFAPPKDLIFKWISQTISIEEQMKNKENIASEFADLLYERGVNLVVLKGLAYAANFPNPYHRESGDLDFFLLGKKEDGDNIAIEIGAAMKEAGYKHSHLYYKGLTIENHSFLTSFDNSKRGIATEQKLQELINIGYSPIDGTKLLKPSADFTALFLIKHALRHFIKEGIRLRHVLDWAFFLKSESKNVNWEEIIPLMEECKILNFAKVLTCVCNTRFGMNIAIDGLDDNMGITESVVSDIMGEQPDFFSENYIQKILRITRRVKRMWKFRSIADETYIQLLWNSIAFNSYIKRKPTI